MSIGVSQNVALALPSRVRIAAGLEEAVELIDRADTAGIYLRSSFPEHRDLPRAVQTFIESQHIEIRFDNHPVRTVESSVSEALREYGFPEGHDQVLSSMAADVATIAKAVEMIAGASDLVQVRISSQWVRGPSWHLDPNRIVGKHVYIGPGTQIVEDSDVLDFDRTTEIRVRDEAEFYSVPSQWIAISRGSRWVSIGPDGEKVWSRGLVHRRPPDPWGGCPPRRLIALVFQDRPDAPQFVGP